MAFNTQQVYSFGNSIYLLTDSDTTWGEAQNEAISLGGNLATINNAQESAFLSGLFAGQAVWIGLTDAASEGNFTWMSGEPVSYTNWQEGQPDNAYGLDHYVAISGTGGRWYDQRGDGGNGVNYQGIVEITNPSTPTIYINDIDVIEPYGGTKEAVLTVKVLGTITNPLLVSYSTADGTAFANSDYTPTSGTLTFSPSTQPFQTQEIRVTVRGDSDDVTGENFFVNLNQPSGAVLAQNQAEITIRERSEVETFGNSAYVVTTTNDIWGTVREEAHRLGGDLVTINDAQEQIFVSGLVGDSGQWIGLTDVALEETFEWVKGASGYTNWKEGQPDNAYGLDHYVVIGRDSLWYDQRGDGGNGVNYQGIAELPITSYTEVNNPLSNPVYRFYNTVAGGHFFTVSEAERDLVLNTLPQYQYEGAGMLASSVEGDNLLPVYRFYNTIAGGHFFTTSDAERDLVLSTLPQYTYEGIGFYAYGAETNLGADVYRFYNTVAGGHFFTTSEAERDLVLSTLPQFTFEGTGFEAAFA